MGADDMNCFRFFSWALLIAPTLAFANLTVSDLTVDQLSQPLGIDHAQPRLSWKLHSDTPSTLQTANEIRVASPAQVEANAWWSTNKVDSDQSLYISYAGLALQSATQYQWQVRVWDNHGNVSEWSTPSQWEMGLLQAGEVPANTTAEFVFPVANATLTRDGAPLAVGNGIENIAVDAARQRVLRLGSGRYRFAN